MQASVSFLHGPWDGASSFWLPIIPCLNESRAIKSGTFYVTRNKDVKIVLEGEKFHAGFSAQELLRHHASSSRPVRCALLLKMEKKQLKIVSLQERLLLQQGAACRRPLRGCLVWPRQDLGVPSLLPLHPPLSWGWQLLLQLQRVPVGALGVAVWFSDVFPLKQLCRALVWQTGSAMGWPRAPHAVLGASHTDEVSSPSPARQNHPGVKIPAWG